MMWTGTSHVLSRQMEDGHLWTLLKDSVLRATRLLLSPLPVLKDCPRLSAGRLIVRELHLPAVMLSRAQRPGSGHRGPELSHGVF